MDQKVQPPAPQRRRGRRQQEPEGRRRRGYSGRKTSSAPVWIGVAVVLVALVGVTVWMATRTIATSDAIALEEQMDSAEFAAVEALKLMRNDPIEFDQRYPDVDRIYNVRDWAFSDTKRVSADGFTETFFVHIDSSTRGGEAISLRWGIEMQRKRDEQDFDHIYWKLNRVYEAP